MLLSQSSKEHLHTLVEQKTITTQQAYDLLRLKTTKSFMDQWLTLHKHDTQKVWEYILHTMWKDKETIHSKPQIVILKVISQQGHLQKQKVDWREQYQFTPSQINTAIFELEQQNIVHKIDIRGKLTIITFTRPFITKTQQNHV